MKYAKYLAMAGIAILLFAGFDSLEKARSSLTERDLITNKDTCTDIIVGHHLPHRLLPGVPGARGACSIP
jgi:hypothetical protein